MNGPRRLSDVDEQELLDLIVPLLGAQPTGAVTSGQDPSMLPAAEPARLAGVLVGPGDDAAVLDAPGPTVVTTDAMVRGRDWRDDWSAPADVGAKVVTQNLADVAAMGARPTGLVVTLLAEPQTTLDWVLRFARGLGEAARAAGCPVLGGDLSSAPAGQLAVSVTALGSLDGQRAVLRSGARPGDVVAVCGTLGHSGAGLELLQQGRAETDPALVRAHRRPVAPLSAGPQAARAGAHAMLDLSDGLLRDSARIAAASRVCLELSGAALDPYAARLTTAVGAAVAWDCVLAGGEEHSLLACFPAAAGLPPGWVMIGRVVEGHGVRLDGQPQSPRGWDHFRS